MLRGEELIQLSTPRLVETEAGMNADTTERTMLAVTGHASACDVWFKVPTAWEAVVTLRLYARVGDARVLLKTVRINEAHRSSAGGFVSGAAMSVRGRPVTSFELTAQASSGSLTNGQFMLYLWHANEAPAIIGGVVGVSPQAGEERSIAQLVVRNDNTPVFAAADPSGRQLVAGVGTGGTPGGGVLTVQGHGASGAVLTRPADNSGIFALSSPIVRLAVGAASTFVLNLWHPSASAKRVLIHRVLVSFHGPTSLTTGDVTLRGTRTTSLGTGVAATAVALDQAESATLSGASAAFTTAPTTDATAKDYFRLAARGDQRGAFVWDASEWGKPIVLRENVGEGFAIRAVVEAALGAANQFTVAATIQFQEV